MQECRGPLDERASPPLAVEPLLTAVALASAAFRGLVVGGVVGTVPVLAVLLGARGATLGESSLFGVLSLGITSFAATLVALVERSARRSPRSRRHDLLAGLAAWLVAYHALLLVVFQLAYLGATSARGPSIDLALASRRVWEIVRGASVAHLALATALAAPVAPTVFLRLFEIPRVVRALAGTFAGFVLATLVVLPLIFGASPREALPLLACLGGIALATPAAFELAEWLETRLLAALRPRRAPTRAPRTAPTATPEERLAASASPVEPVSCLGGPRAQRTERSAPLSTPRRQDAESS